MVWIVVLTAAAGAFGADALSRSVTDPYAKFSRSIQELASYTKKEQRVWQEVKQEMKVDLSSNECKPGFAYISDLDECKYVLSELGYTYNAYYQATPRTDRPTGCIWHTDGNGYFNPKGQHAASDQAPVCKPPVGLVVASASQSDEKANSTAEGEIQHGVDYWANLGESKGVSQKATSA